MTTSLPSPQKLIGHIVAGKSGVTIQNFIPPLNPTITFTPKEATWWTKVDVIERKNSLCCLVWTASPASNHFSAVCGEIHLSKELPPEGILQLALERARRIVKPYAFLQWAKTQMRKKYGDLEEEPSFKKLLRNLVSEWPISNPDSWAFLAENLKLQPEFATSPFNEKAATGI